MIVNDDKRTTFLTILVVALVIASPVIIKWVLNQDSQVSEESYYNLRIINQINSQEGVRGQHVDALQNKEYSYSLFYLLFSKKNSDFQFVAKIFPLIMGIISVFLFYLLLRSINLGQDDIFFGIIILVSTPIFIYSFTTFSPDILALPVFLLGIILFSRGNYFSFIFVGATAFINIFYTILSLLIILGDYFFRHKRKAIFIVNLSAIVLSVLAGIFLFGMNYALQFVPLLTGLNGFIIEFGAVNGYALITLGLAFIGLFSWWNAEKSRTVIFISVLLIIFASLFFQSMRLPVALIMAVFAGFSISYLSNREWEIYMLKGVTLLLVFCILFFSAVLALNFQTKNITDKEIAAISYLSSANSKDIILSAERNGFLIEYVSGRGAYLDDNSYRFSDYEERKNMADRIYYSKNLKELESLLIQERITHIMVDSEMKAGEVWNGRYEGLLFFLENSDSFIKIFYDEDIQIYRYVGRESSSTQGI